MSKFTAAELEEHFHGVANGGIAQYLPDYTGVWESMGEAMTPSYGSDTDRWRVKPANKIIDISHFIESGIDCEFSNNGGTWGVGTLVAMVDPSKGYPERIYMKDYVDRHTRPYRYCRPRMNHKMFHDSGECPLPEGFRVKVWFREGNACIGDCEDFRWGYGNLMTDIIGYEILGLADGYSYERESEL